MEFLIWETGKAQQDLREAHTVMPLSQGFGGAIGAQQVLACSLTFLDSSCIYTAARRQISWFVTVKMDSVAFLFFFYRRLISSLDRVLSNEKGGYTFIDFF